MATAFDTFNQYATQAYEGQLADRSLADIVSRVADGSDIDAGLAVADTGERTASLVSGELVPTGIQIRMFADENKDASNPQSYTPEGHEMSVARVGRVWVRAVDGAALNQPVYVNPADSTITNDPNGTLDVEADSNNTGDGTVGSTAVVAGALPGEYRAVCTATATDGGTFTVYDPNGIRIGTVDVGVAFDNGIQFTISDGAADFALGDKFYLYVETAHNHFPGASFRTAASASELALVQLNGND